MAVDNSESVRAGIELNATTLGRGVAIGAAAYVLGYVLVAALASGLPSRFSSSVPAWKAIGWYFYNAHFVDLTATVSAFGASRTSSGSLIAASNRSLANLMYVVPPLALLVGGGVLARLFDAVADPADGVKAGALVVLGYLPLAAIGAVVTVQEVSREVVFVNVSGSVGPQLAPAVVLAGLVYPIAFGAIGGAVAAAFE